MSVNAKVPLPKNYQENDDLYQAIRQLGLKSAALDGTDLAKEGEWRDSTGQLISFFNWQPGQPDNILKKEHYLHYHAWWGKKWNDNPGSREENIVCQMKPGGKLNLTK